MPIKATTSFTRQTRRPAPITEAACWAHWRRLFVDLVEDSKAPAPIALEAVRRMDELFEIERMINGRSPQERVVARDELSKPLIDALDAWLHEQLRRLSAKNETAKAINYGLSRWTAFTLFLRDGRVCLSNNAAERSVRGIAVAAATGHSPAPTKAAGTPQPSTL